MIQVARTHVTEPNSRAISLATRKTDCPPSIQPRPQWQTRDQAHGPAASFCYSQLGPLGSPQLVVNGFRFRLGKKFLKIWIIADRVPDRVDLQTRNGNELTGRGCDELANYFYRVLAVAGARFDFGQSRKKRR